MNALGVWVLLIEVPARVWVSSVWACGERGGEAANVSEGDAGLVESSGGGGGAGGNVGEREADGVCSGDCWQRENHVVVE